MGVAAVDGTPQPESAAPISTRRSVFLIYVGERRRDEKTCRVGTPWSVANNLQLARLHRDILGCTRCVVAGYLARAAPVLSGHADNRIMLIGQAPGAVEAERRLPFQGRSGKVLMEWLARAGFASEAEARRRIYITSVTKCFPGKVACPDARWPTWSEGSSTSRATRWGPEPAPGRCCSRCRTHPAPAAGSTIRGTGSSSTEPCADCALWQRQLLDQKLAGA